MEKRWNRKRLWTNSAAFLRDKVRTIRLFARVPPPHLRSSTSLLVQKYLAILEELEFREDDEAKIICDPFFSATSKNDVLNVDRCYDVTPVFKPGLGVWTIELRLDWEDSDEVWYLSLRKQRTGDIPQRKRKMRKAIGTRAGRARGRPAAKASIPPILTRPTWKSYPLYLDAASNCVLVGKPDKTLAEVSMEADTA